ncbi:CBO0543 family protein [Paenibacillus xanthanilyticus]|uniref:CBO0543 family protein n=1 Tax=Paenibacillus xanthanilyticus TaxID=1783531 RepID=A0ABV8K120_9BACL
MDQGQAQQFEQIRQAKLDEAGIIHRYWLNYSNVDTWQFWLLAALFVIPLIVLFWKMDRSKALLLGFFGLNVHIWFSYVDTFGVERGMWGYPYKFVPFLPESITLDTSLVPVTFMLLYQWCIHTRRNFYLFGIALCGAYSFGLKPIMVQLDLFHMYRGMNFIYLFLLYLLVFGLAVGVTAIFLALRKAGSEGASKSRWFIKIPGRNSFRVKVK